MLNIAPKIYDDDYTIATEIKQKNDVIKSIFKKLIHKACITTYKAIFDHPDAQIDIFKVRLVSARL
jgi:hypothetical protein